MKAFGKDVGKHVEGRRNHIESFKYIAINGSNRTRIKFNVKGNKAKVIVYAEVSDNMNANELVYLICQDSRTGKVVTVIDNREMLDNKEASGDKKSNTWLNYFSFAK